MDIALRIAKVIVAFGIIGLILWKMPIFELMYLFVYVFVIPIVFLAAIGLISTETAAFIFSGAGNLRARIDEKRQEIYEKMAEANETNPAMQWQQ